MMEGYETIAAYIQIGRIPAMKLISHIVAAAGICAALLSPAVQASTATLSFAGGTNSAVGADFNPNWAAGFSAAGFDLTHMQLGSSLSLDTLANVTYTYVGKEASYTNLFQSFVTSYGADGQQITGSFANLGTSISFNNIGAGSLNYGFISNGLGSLFSNGSGATGVALSSDKKSALIFFNDNWTGDRDYDDMIIKVSVLAVPEPENYALLLAGLGVMGTIVRRRKTHSSQS